MCAPSEAAGARGGGVGAPPTHANDSEPALGPDPSLVDGNFARLLAFPAHTSASGMATRGVPQSSPSQAFSVGRQLRATLLVALAASGALCLTGCGHTIYAINVNSASAKLEEAHELGAELYAPYEYWFALEHLDKAQTEASEGDYGDAIELAGVGEEYADKAIQLARDAHRGAGR